MPSSWITALKEWNAGKGGSWCVPKKGTTDYDAVRKLMPPKKLKGAAAAVAAPAKMEVAPIKKRRITVKKPEAEAAPEVAPEPPKAEAVKTITKKRRIITPEMKAAKEAAKKELLKRFLTKAALKKRGKKMIEGVKTERKQAKVGKFLESVALKKRGKKELLKAKQEVSAAKAKAESPMEKMYRSAYEAYYNNWIKKRKEHFDYVDKIQELGEKSRKGPMSQRNQYVELLAASNISNPYAESDPVSFDEFVETSEAKKKAEKERFETAPAKVLEWEAKQKEKIDEYVKKMGEKVVMKAPIIEMPEKRTADALRAALKEKKVSGFSGKKVDELVKMIEDHNESVMKKFGSTADRKAQADEAKTKMENWLDIMMYMAKLTKDDLMEISNKRMNVLRNTVKKRQDIIQTGRRLEKEGKTAEAQEEFDYAKKIENITDWFNDHLPNMLSSAADMIRGNFTYVSEVSPERGQVPSLSAFKKALEEGDVAVSRPEKKAAAAAPEEKAEVNLEKMKKSQLQQIIIDWSAKRGSRFSNIATAKNDKLIDLIKKYNMV